MSTNNAIDTGLVISVAQGGTGNSTFTANGVLYATSGPTWTSSLGATGTFLVNGGNVGVPYWATLAAGSMSLIRTVTLGASTGAVTFTGLPTASPQQPTFSLRLSGIIGSAVTADLLMRVSTNNGTSYLNSGYTSTRYYVIYNSSTNNTTTNSTAYDIGYCTTNSQTSGSCYFTLPNASTSTCGYNSQFTAFISGGSYFGNGVGFTSTSTVNAIQILPSTGTLSSGCEFSLFQYLN